MDIIDLHYFTRNTIFNCPFPIEGAGPASPKIRSQPYLHPPQLLHNKPIPSSVRCIKHYFEQVSFLLHNIFEQYCTTFLLYTSTYNSRERNALQCNLQTLKAQLNSVMALLNIQANTSTEYLDVIDIETTDPPYYPYNPQYSNTYTNNNRHLHSHIRTSLSTTFWD